MMLQNSIYRDGSIIKRTKERNKAIQNEEKLNLHFLLVEANLKEYLSSLFPQVAETRFQTDGK